MSPPVTPILTDPPSAAETLAGDEDHRIPETLPGASSGRERGAMLARGAMLGRYIVLDTLGRGGMGIVYAAYDPELDRKVALKLLLPGRERGSSARARLQREAQAIARVSHPNVVAVHDVGAVGEQVFIAMELVEGMDLARWLAAGPHTQAEILELLLQAGAGLAAAHAAELVHRDFKPENVLVGRDGRARVVDFGLVRKDETASLSVSADELPPETSQRREAMYAELRLTDAGALVGTPAYMSPEQLHGLGGDARSDQFSYCVALYEALYGERPFAGASVPELTAAVTLGMVRAPSQRAVPGRLRQVLLRGLAVDPQARYPSMDALLAALRKAAAPRRRRWWAAVGVAALGGGAGLLAMGAHEQGCELAADRVAHTWSPARSEALRERFEQTGLSYAADTWQRVQGHLDGYTHEWAAQALAACEAARGLDPATATVELQRGCLDEHLDELDALLAIFERADARVVTNAVSLARGLSSVKDCSRPDGHYARPVPSDPALSEQVHAVRQELQRISMESRTGLDQGGPSTAAGLLERAEALGYGPLLAEALTVQADAEERVGDLEHATEHHERAFEAALASRHDMHAFMTAVSMVFLHGVARREPRLGLRWASRAEALLRRVGDDPKRRVPLLTSWANAHAINGDDAEAQARYDEALALARELDDEVILATIVNNVGAFHAERRRLEVAQPHLEEAAALNAGIFGPGHPNTLRTRANLGVVAVMSGHPREGQEILEDVLAEQEVALGPDHPELVVTLEGLASALTRVGKLDAAVGLRRRVLASRERSHGPHSAATWTARTNLAGLLVHAEQHAEAHELMVALLAELDATPSADPRRRAHVLDVMASTTKALGRPRETLGHVDELLALCESTQCPKELEANARLAEGDARLALGDPIGARRAFEAVLELPKSTFEASARPRAALRLARLMVADDRKAAVGLARRVLGETTAVDVPTLEVLRELEAWLREHG